MSMTCRALGLGVWMRGANSYREFCDVVAGSRQNPDVPFKGPAPVAIPSRERRRAGLMINLAVEVAHQACEQAGVDKSATPSVFASAMGDTEITDYMCRKLTQPEKLLSPTKFHNSVHNAPSGYWSISAENRAPSTFVGGFTESFGAGLLETITQVGSWGCPVLLVAYDIANHAPFDDVLAVRETLGFALVLGPAAAAVQEGALSVDLSWELRAGDQSQPTRPGNPALARVAGDNPMGAALALGERLVTAKSEACALQIPVSMGTVMHLTVTDGSHG